MHGLAFWEDDCFTQGLRRIRAVLYIGWGLRLGVTDCDCGVGLVPKYDVLSARIVLTACDYVCKFNGVLDESSLMATFFCCGLLASLLMPAPRPIK